MARGFDEQEKQWIQHALIEQGKLLFGKYGFQKTSIQELTSNVGIAQGSFYTFFSSKEELYFLILEIEEEKLREQFLDFKGDEREKPKEIFKKILREMVTAIETNPFIRQLFIGNNFKNIVRKLPPKLLETHLFHDAEALLPFIEKWHSLGIELKKEPTIIAGLLRSLFLLTMHRREIGEAVYEETIELFIHLIAEGMIKDDKDVSHNRNKTSM